jgi:hypothetical protein
VPSTLIDEALHAVAKAFKRDSSDRVHDDTMTNRKRLAAIALVVVSAGSEAQGAPKDTIRLEVGSPLVDGRVFVPYAARATFRIGDRIITESTERMTLGDSVGRPVMRWVSRSESRLSPTRVDTTEVRETYDARTFAPLAFGMGATRLAIEGRRVTGTRPVPGSARLRQVDTTISGRGFFLGGSNLIPIAVGLRAGAVIVAPIWNPSLNDPVLDIFTVIGKATVDVGGARVDAWKVEERWYADRKLRATWYVVAAPPYVIHGEVRLPDGQSVRMTKVSIPMPSQ